MPSGSPARTRRVEAPEAAPPAALTAAGSVSPEELARLFAEFSRSTRRLQESHRALETRVSELRNELADKNRQLERKKRLEALGLMVAGVAHEIRNPLGSIALYVDCLAQEVRGSRSEAESIGLLRSIEEVVGHLNSVVENMLVFASESPGRLEPCDLGLQLEEALNLLRGELEKRTVRVGVEPIAGSTAGPGPPLVLANPDQIRCVFVNVLKNALEAMRGGGEIDVRLACVAEEERLLWRVIIADSGPGIPPENLEKVLVPFYSDPDKRGGVGLGLTIVHSLLERQGGRLELRNRDPHGLEVALFFAAHAVAQNARRPR